MSENGAFLSKKNRSRCILTYNISMLLDILFPKTCLSCNSFGSYICVGCRRKVEYIEKDSCLKCDRIHTNGFIHADCKDQEGIDGYLSIFYYTEITKKIIKGIKYKFVKDSCKELFSMIPTEKLKKLDIFRASCTEYSLQPVPLHTSREAKRGFNQAEIIAKFFQQQTSYPIINVLKRTKKTHAQAQTADKVERIQNIKNAFQLKKGVNIKNKNIILVDDVITTGCTVKEAAKVLKQNGAQSVFVFTLAHG